MVDISVLTPPAATTDDGDVMDDGDYNGFVVSTGGTNGGTVFATIFVPKYISPTSLSMV